jgi:mediator of RNA polymerase II transcription subunit 7
MAQPLGAPAEAPEQQQLYPPPPPYFARLAAAAAAGVPPPPPPPVSGEYLSFGELHSTLDALPPLHVRALFAGGPGGPPDPRAALLELHRELAAAVLELLAVLADRPAGYARAVEAVGLALRNLQYLAGLLRPRQARAALAGALRAEARAKRGAAEALRAAARAADAAAAAAAAVLDAARAALEAGEGGMDVDGPA